MIKQTKLRLHSWEEISQYLNPTAQKTKLINLGGRRWGQLKGLCYQWILAHTLGLWLWDT